MLEISLDEANDKNISLNKSNQLNEYETFVKKFKLFLIIALILILVLIIIIITLACVFLSKDSGDSSQKTIEYKKIPEDIKNFIKLEVNSENDNTEIFFLSEEYKPNERDNYTIYIDEYYSDTKKSKKLDKGIHNITISFKEGIFTCQNMFKNCKDITNIYINSSNSCNDIDSMFNGCSSLTSINFDNFITSKVISMKNTFSNCTEIKELNLENFDTRNVNNMGEMFKGCNSLENINLTTFNTKNVKNMEGMFNGCSQLKTLDISSFDTYFVENMYHIFNGCNSLKSADISNFISYKLKTNIIDLFGNIKQNTFLEEMYNTLSKIKNEEKIIKDIDSNVVINIHTYKREKENLVCF